MAAPDAEQRYTIVCPHCNRSFESPLLGGRRSRYQGFKCPHCRLFVSYSSVEGKLRAEPQR